MLGPTMAVAVFSPSVSPAPLIHRLWSDGGCEKDCLTLDTVVSNSNEDSEQRQTKVHGDDIKGAAGDGRQPALSCFSGQSRPPLSQGSLGRIGK